MIEICNMSEKTTVFDVAELTGNSTLARCILLPDGKTVLNSEKMRHEVASLVLMRRGFLIVFRGNDDLNVTTQEYFEKAPE